MSFYKDLFSGTAATALSAHTSDSGATYTRSGGGGSDIAFLDGSGHLYFTIADSTIYTVTGYSFPSSGPIQLTFDVYCASSANSSQLQLLNGSGNGYRFLLFSNTLYFQTAEGVTTIGTASVTLTGGHTYPCSIDKDAAGNWTVIFDIGGQNATVTGNNTTYAPTLIAFVGLTAGTSSTGLMFANMAGTALLYAAAPVAAQASATSVMVTWPAPTGGTAPLQWKLQLAPDVSGSPGTYADVTSYGTATSYTDTGLTTGNYYWYRVAAEDSTTPTPATAVSAGFKIQATAPTATGIVKYILDGASVFASDSGTSGNGTGHLYDNDLTDYFQSSTSTNAYAGLDAGSGQTQVPTSISVAACAQFGHDTSCLGALIQGGTAPAGTYTTLGSLPDGTVAGGGYVGCYELRTISLMPAGGWRTVRILTAGYCELAELQVYGWWFSGTRWQPAMPILSPAAGRLVNGSTVTITCPTTNASFYYTTDGTTPTLSGGVPQGTTTLYSGPITLPINAQTTIKAIAYHASGTVATSDVATGTFLCPQKFVPDSGTSSLGGSNHNPDIFYGSDGHRLQSHYGDLFYDPQSGKLLSIGQDHRVPSNNAALSPHGITFYDWTDPYNPSPLGMLLPDVPTGWVDTNGYHYDTINRAKMHYNASPVDINRTYVIICRLDTSQSGYAQGRMGVATSRYINGPWTWVSKLLPSGATAIGDCNLLEDGSSTFFVFNDNNTNIKIATLDPTTDCTTFSGASLINLTNIAGVEAPAAVKYGGYYYLVCSNGLAYGQAGPANLRYWSATTLAGLNSATGASIWSSTPATTDAAYSMQSVCFTIVQGRLGFIFVCDWGDSGASTTLMFNAQYGLYPVPPSAISGGVLSISPVTSWDLSALPASTSITASPTTIAEGTTTTVTVVGSGTNFTSVSQFSLSGGTGASIVTGSSTINSTTSATLVIQGGTALGANILTLEDTGTSTTYTLSVADQTPPTTPTSLGASSVAQTTLTVSWTASTDNVTAQGSLVYLVYRGGVLIDTTAAGVTSFNDSGLSANTAYAYAVKAEDAVGNISAASSTLNVTTLAASLTPPVLTLVSHNSSGQSFSWTATGTTYNLYQGGWSKGEWIKVKGISGTTYTDTAVQSGNTNPMYYTVTAVDGSGNESAFSNEVSVNSASPTYPSTVPTMADSTWKAAWVRAIAENHPLAAVAVAEATSPGSVSPSDNFRYSALTAAIAENNMSWAATAFAAIVTGANAMNNGNVTDPNLLRSNLPLALISYSMLNVMGYFTAHPSDLTTFTTAMNQMCDNTLSSDTDVQARTSDSDQTTAGYGVYVWATLSASFNATKSASYIAAVNQSSQPLFGGLTPTNDDAYPSSTVRNAIETFCREAAGGQWIESCDYNTNTQPLLIGVVESLRTFTGTDYFPEATRLYREFGQSMTAQLMPDNAQVTHWGDEESWARTIKTWQRLPNIAMAAFLCQDDQNVSPYVQHLVIKVLNKCGWTGSISGTPGALGPYDGSIFPFWHPYLPVADYTTAPWLEPGSGGFATYDNPGMGMTFIRDGNTASSTKITLFSNNPVGVDHQMRHVSNWEVWRDGEWCFTFPQIYYAGNLIANGLITSGFLMNEFQGRTGIDIASDGSYVYSVAAHGGNLGYAGNYGAPPRWVHEASEGKLALPGTIPTLIVFDRCNCDPLPSSGSGNWAVVDYAWLSSWPLKFFNIHAGPGNTPTISGNTVTWTTTGGQLCQTQVLTSGLASSSIVVTSANAGPNSSGTHDNQGIYGPSLGGYSSSENDTIVQYAPSSYNKWDTFLVVQQTGNLTGASNTHVFSTSNEAEGVLVHRPGENDVLAMFNATQGADLPATTWNVGDDLVYSGNTPAQILAARLRTTGYTVDFTTATSSATVLLCDLDPSKHWTATLDASPVTMTMSPGPSGQMGSIAVSGSGSHAIVLSASSTVPILTSKYPTPYTAVASPAQTVTATFSESVATTNPTFTVTDWQGNSVAGTASYNDGTLTASFVPTSNLSTSQSYIATVSGAQGTAHNTMQPQSWTFATEAPGGSSPPPPPPPPVAPIPGTLALNGSVTYNSVPLSIATDSGGAGAPYSNQLKRSDDGGATYSPKGSPVVGTTGTFTDGTVSASTLYKYKVNVTDSGSNSADSNVLSVTTAAAPILVASPTNLTPNQTGVVVTLTETGASWTPGTPGSPTITIVKTPTNDASITAQTISSATAGQITLSTGATIGTLTITDPSTGKTATLSVGGRVVSVTLNTGAALHHISEATATNNGSQRNRGNSSTGNGGVSRQTYKSAAGNVGDFLSN